MSRRIRQWIGFLIMLVGLGLLAGPFLLGYREEQAQEQTVDTFYQSLNREEPSLDLTTDEEETEAPTQEPQEPQEPQDAFYRDAKAYNAQLKLNGQDAMNRLADVEQFALSALDYGYTENIIGTIRIPRLEIELGLYLGANSQNMAKGAAIFGMTSLPLGGESENTAIAGHRGWRGTPMFREIQKLQIDDPVYIETPWQTLVYRVCGILITTPEDNSWCKIQEGRTLISLMTCHPYGHNYQRYIVFAELCQEEKPSEEEIIENNLASFDPAPREVTMVNADGTSQIVTVDPVSIEPDSSEYGAVLSNFVILAENKMKIAACIAAVLVVFVGIWLTAATIRDLRKRRKQE